MNEIVEKKYFDVYVSWSDNSSLVKCIIAIQIIVVCVNIATSIQTYLQLWERLLREIVSLYLGLVKLI